MALTLTIWDSVFAACQRTDLNEDDLKDLQGRIDLGMEYTRKMGLLVTSKYHGVERHMVKNIRSIPGGIAKKFEYWMEKYHQDGVKLDMLHQMEKSVEKFARIRLKSQTIASIPEVQQRIQRKDAQHTRGKRKVTAQKEKAARAAKKARRDVLSQVLKERGAKNDE